MHEVEGIGVLNGDLVVTRLQEDHANTGSGTGSRFCGHPTEDRRTHVVVEIVERDDECVEGNRGPGDRVDELDGDRNLLFGRGEHALVGRVVRAFVAQVVDAVFIGITVWSRVGEVIDAVAVGVAVWRGVLQVLDAIAVGVDVAEWRGIAGVADSIPIRIELVGVGGGGAVVDVFVDAVAIRIAVWCGVGAIRNAVTVGIGLAPGCGIAGVTGEIGVGVELVGVGDLCAIVERVLDAVAVEVGHLSAVLGGDEPQRYRLANKREDERENHEKCREPLGCTHGGNPCTRSPASFPGMHGLAEHANTPPVTNRC